MIGVQGFGGYVPEHVMTNDDWSVLLETSDEWITQRTGIKERRIAGDDETTLTMATIAAERAIEDAGLTPEDIDEIILATDTREILTPDTSALLQDRLGCRQIPTFDLGGSGCAGFVQGMDVARARITLEPKRVLVVGVELITRLLSKEDRSTAVLFGDAAGAIVLSGEPGRAEFLDGLAGTDGSKSEILIVEVGGTRTPFSPETLADGSYQRIVMHGREVFKEAVGHMSGSIIQLLERIGRSLEDVALVIPHQANLRIIDAVAKKLGAKPDQVFVNVDRYGNTGSASVPLALWEASNQGRINPGDLVILTAFGAGFHWAAAALQF